MVDAAELKGFNVTPLTFRNTRRDILISETGGRPVILMHELYGLTRSVVDFARRLNAAGYRVYVPVLFGSSDPAASKAGRLLALPCILAEFRVLSANDPGPWADWIRELAAHVYAACQATPGKGVGVVGLCLTGNLALSAALSPVVTAAVMSEPSLPGHISGGLHVSAAELKGVRMRTTEESLLIQGYRYAQDRICRAERFSDLKAALGAGFDGVTIPTSDKRLHSVFTEHYLGPGGSPRHGELQTLLNYLAPRI